MRGCRENLSIMDSTLKELLSEFYGNAPAPPDSISLLQEHFRKFGKSLPSDLRQILEERDGAEGFVGGHYVVIWGTAEIVEYNKSYGAPEHASGLILFGSNGGGEAFAFDARSSGLPVVKVPFVGMQLKLVEMLAPTFTELLKKWAADTSVHSRIGNTQHLAGMEIFEVTPVMLGGSPIDPENKVFLNRKQHIEAVQYWNNVIRDLKARRDG
jgi:hypothetical protein